MYIDLNRIEFVITNACSDRCKHLDLSVPCGSSPYTSRLDAISCFGINPNGDVDLCSITIGNIYRQDILDIIDAYNPYKTLSTRALLNGGVAELLSYAETLAVAADISDCRSACGVSKDNGGN